MCRDRRAECWSGSTTVKARQQPIQTGSDTISSFECVRIGNYTRKRKVSPQESLHQSSDYEKPWMKTLNSAEYKHAKLSNGSTYRVYTHPGNYIAMNSKRFKMQQAWLEKGLLDADLKDCLEYFLKALFVNILSSFCCSGLESWCQLRNNGVFGVRWRIFSLFGANANAFIPVHVYQQ